MSGATVTVVDSTQREPAPASSADISESEPAAALTPAFRTTARALQSGDASWYASKFCGRRTASGERYDQLSMTAAHRSLPFGTYVRVTLLATDKSVIVRINDRGPFVKGRVIDLSYAAAKALGLPYARMRRVRIEPVEKTADKMTTADGSES